MSQVNEAPRGAAEAVAAAIETAMELVPFARWLGLELTAIADNRVYMRFAMRDEFVGNPERNILHGGITASVLDTVGGFAALLGVLSRGPQTSNGADPSPWLSTIDMRTDFLRPGIGDDFTACAFPLRVGNRLVVTRMELHTDPGGLIAVGTGTYVSP